MFSNAFEMWSRNKKTERQKTVDAADIFAELRSPAMSDDGVSLMNILAVC